MFDLYGEEIRTGNYVQADFTSYGEPIKVYFVRRASTLAVELMDENAKTWGVDQRLVLKHDVQLVPYCSVRNRLLDGSLPPDFFDFSLPPKYELSRYRYRKFFENIFRKAIPQYFEKNNRIVIKEVKDVIVPTFEASDSPSRFEAKLQAFEAARRVWWSFESLRI